MTNFPLLEVKNVSKGFSVKEGFLRKEVGKVRALEDFSLKVDPGKIVALVGESGCGKSTAAKVVMRLLKPDSGKIFFKSCDLLTLNEAELKKIRPSIQMVFQDPSSSLNPRYAIGEQIARPVLYHKLANSYDQALKIAEEMLFKVGLEKEALERYPHQFSGGQQQRICIARSLALGPELLVCDEALSALDVSIQAQILNLLSDLRKTLNIAILFITHDLNLVRYFCDDVVVMYLGQVMESCSSMALFSDPKHPYTRLLLSSVPRSSPFENKKIFQEIGDLPSALNPPSGCPFRTRCPFAQKTCEKTPPAQLFYDPATGKNTHLVNCVLDFTLEIGSQIK